MKKNLKPQNYQPQYVAIDVLLGRAAMLGFMFALGAYLTADIVMPSVI